MVSCTSSFPVSSTQCRGSCHHVEPVPSIHSLPSKQRRKSIRARVTWKVDVTTTIRFHPCSRASRATVRASPCVLYGFAVKQRTSYRVDPRVQAPGEHDDGVGLRGRRVGPRPDEEHGAEDEPRPHEDAEREEESA